MNEWMNGNISLTALAYKSLLENAFIWLDLAFKKMQYMKLLKYFAVVLKQTCDFVKLLPPKAQKSPLSHWLLQIQIRAFAEQPHKGTVSQLQTTSVPPVVSVFIIPTLASCLHGNTVCDYCKACIVFIFNKNYFSLLCWLDDALLYLHA